MVEKIEWDFLKSDINNKPMNTVETNNENLILQDGSTIAIIGGGPAGCSCAIKLKLESAKHSKNIHVILFEGKDFENHYNQCVGVLSPPVIRIITELLGIEFPWDLIQQRIFAYRLHSPARELLLVGQGISEPTYTIRRVKFDKMLLHHASNLGVEIIHSRATGIEFINSYPHNEVRVYSESGYHRADAVVGAFGTDDSMHTIFEKSTNGNNRYRRPGKYLKTFITKFYTGKTFIDRKVGGTIYAFLTPPCIPDIEFGAITPKEDHVIVNIAGGNITSLDMDRFLQLPQVTAHLPEFDMNVLSYFEGKFPISPAKNPFGDRYVMVGDATGWMRPFKGKGINTALLTGIRAADTMLRYGFSREAFKHYALDSKELLDDYHYGAAVRYLCKYILKNSILDSVIESGMTDPIIYNALYNSVSGEKPYKVVIKSMLNIISIKRIIKSIAKKYFNTDKSHTTRAKHAGKDVSIKGGNKLDDILIRRLNARDIDFIMQIDEKITGKPREAYWESKIASYMSRDPMACFVAEIDERIVGFVLGDIRGWEYAIPLTGWLEIIGVDPDYRGKGVGKKLSEALFDYFRKNGLKNIMTMVNWNEVDLIDYFGSMGFERGEFINLIKKL